MSTVITSAAPATVVARASDCRDQRLAPSDEWRICGGSCPPATSIIGLPCVPIQHPRSAARQPRAVRGFTLIELLVTVAVAGVLSSVALPSFEGQLHKARRADVLVSMMLVQAAQERFRSNGASYGSLAAVGVAPLSSAGHYTLALPAFDDAGFELLATATGSQARDTACSHMRLTVSGANLVYTSGSTAAASNPPSANRACWNL